MGHPMRLVLPPATSSLSLPDFELHNIGYLSTYSRIRITLHTGVKLALND